MNFTKRIYMLYGNIHRSIETNTEQFNFFPQQKKTIRKYNENQLRNEMTKCCLNVYHHFRL